MIPDHIIERSSIIQYDGNKTRAEADKLAGIYKEGEILFSINQPNNITDADIEHARAWCRERSLTNEDVAIRKNEFQVYVIAKQDVGF